MPPSVKTTANSFANFVYNLLGYLPAPYVYGLVYDNTGGKKSIWGMFSLQCAGVLAVIIMLSLLLKQWRDEANIKSKKPHLEPLTATSADAKPTFCNLSEFDKHRTDTQATSSLQSPQVAELNGRLRFKNAAHLPYHDNEESSTSSFSERDYQMEHHERRAEFDRYFEGESERGGSFRNSVSDRVKQDYNLLSNKSLYPVSINMVDDMSQFDY